MLNISCESLHAFYCYVKQFCVLITVIQWCCQRWDVHVPINLLLSFHTRISLVNIVTQKMYSFEAVNRTKLPYDVNYSQKLMSTSLKLEEVSIYTQVNNTRRGVFYFYKTWCRVLESIRIFEYFRGRILFESTFFQRIPALVTSHHRQSR